MSQQAQQQSPSLATSHKLQQQISLALNPFGDGGLECLANHIRELVSAAGTESSSVKSLDSCIPALGAQPTPDSDILVIDFGGTNTKAARRQISASISEPWSPVFKAGHAELNRPQGGGSNQANAFLRYADNLFGSIAANLAATGTSLNTFDGLGIVWSNVFAATKINSNISGVGALIDTNAPLGNKNEPYLPGIKELGQANADGMLEIGSLLGGIAAQHGFNFKRIAIINDTIGTMLASPGADAGAVSSTGANCTLVKGGTIRNAESGAGIKVPIELLSDAEQDLFQSRPVAIELLCGKIGLQDILVANAVLLKDSAAESLIKDIIALDKQTVGADDRAFEIIKTLWNTPQAEDAFPTLQSANLLPSLESPEQLVPLRCLASEIIERAGRMAGMLCWASICEQVQADPFSARRIALDSSMAGNFPGYLDFAQEALQSQCACAVTIEHIKSDRDEISIPAIGAATAIDNLIAAGN
jgi:hypothetical protein